MNMAEWEGVAGQPAKNLGKITFERFKTFDQDQATNAVNYIKQHVNDDQAILHGREFPQDAQPDQRGAGVRRPVASRATTRIR